MLGRLTNFGMKFKVIDTNKGPKKDGENVEVVFFYSKLDALGGTLTSDVGLMGATFLTILLRKKESLPST